MLLRSMTTTLSGLLVIGAVHAHQRSPVRAKPRPMSPIDLLQRAPAKPAKPSFELQSNLPAAPRQGTLRIDGIVPGERLGGAVAIDDSNLLIGVYSADRPIGIADFSSGAGAGTVQAHTFSGTLWPTDDVLAPGSEGRIVIDEAEVADDAFGRSVDIDGTTAITGMPGDDQAAGWAGAGAVLERSGSGWRVASKLVPNTGQLGVNSVSGWQVGRSVAIDGDIIALGAPRASFAGKTGQQYAEAGAVLIYRRQGTGWAFEAMLTSATPGNFEQFGLSIDLDAGMLVVGIPNADSTSDSNGNQGAIEVFSSSSGQWQRLNRMQSPVFTTPGARFGASVAINGSSIAVGEPGFAVERGRAWVLEQAFDGDTDWTQVTSLDLLVATPPGIPGGAMMGSSIAMTDCTVVVGGPGNGVVESFTGQVWAFTRAANSADSWSYLNIGLVGQEPGDGYGDAVAVSSSFIAVGAWLGGADDAGSVSLVHVSCDCDGDGVPDIEQIALDGELDCNGDGMIDSCQLVFDPALDCDSNGVLDDCQFEPPGAFEWPVTAGGNGNYYRVFTPSSPIDRATAVSLAEAAGGGLASLDATLEAAWVATRSEHDPDEDGTLWLGASQSPTATQPESGWAWDDAMPWSYSAWATGMPDDLDGVEDHEADALIVSEASGTLWVWADINETSTADGLVIEYKPNCDRDAALDACQIAEDPSLDCDLDGRLDSCQLEEGSGSDCDNNGQLDSCDIVAGLAEDCDEDGIIDSCALGNGSAQDCNANGLPDACDILEGTSDDIDGDGIPDECQELSINEVLSEPSDLNGDGFADASDTFVEILNRTGDEIDLSGWRLTLDGSTWHVFPEDSLIAEGCVGVVTGGGSPTETAFGTGLLQAATWGFLYQIPDPGDGTTHTVALRDADNQFVTSLTYSSAVSGVGISSVRCPDITGPVTDHWTCSGISNSPGRDVNGTLLSGCPAPENDPDGDGILDPFDNCPNHANFNQADCDGDGIGDACAVAMGVDSDCDGNGEPDTCELLDGTMEDCNANGLPDICEIANDPQLDCNESGWLDDCEIAWGWETDCNENNLVDWCELDEIGGDCDFDGILDVCEDPGDVEGGPDLNGDCLVDVQDLVIVLNDLGCQAPAFCIGDIDGDGDTDTYDLLLIYEQING
ncbi:MAG: lamin tail domain-containing protein [Phycisphaerales bacterium]|nr:lamin tail domain-containing protein [Phycisphaerales bacterium]